uniref:Lipoprotein n=1 Tax=Arundo donax TaxID=35708 RepID=A0A0A9ED90_ARUDO
MITLYRNMFYSCRQKYGTNFKFDTLLFSCSLISGCTGVNVPYPGVLKNSDLSKKNRNQKCFQKKIMFSFPLFKAYW